MHNLRTRLTLRNSLTDPWKLVGKNESSYISTAVFLDPANQKRMERSVKIPACLAFNQLSLRVLQRMICVVRDVILLWLYVWSS